MKDNKEFIKGIYQKYEDYTTKEQKRKAINKQRYGQLIGIAAMITIIFTIGITYEKRYIKNNPTEGNNILSQTLEEGTTEEIGLAKVGTFENFYQLIKEQESDNNRESVNQEQEKEESLNLADTTQDKSTYSTTNKQVENVDEGDIVKTDGNYLYYITQQKVVIIDIQNQQNSQIQQDLQNQQNTQSNRKVAEISYTESTPRELYINNNKLIVITSENELRTEIKSVYDTADVAYVDGIKLKTSAITYDITDRSNPKEERKVEMEGTYISSRMIEDNIYMATNKYITNAINMVKNYPIEELQEQDYKPTYLDTAVSNETKYIGFDQIRYFDDKQVNNYLLLGGFNINNKQEADIKVFLGAGETVYASSKNMYIAKVKTIYDINTYSLLGEKTQIVKFELSNGKIKYKAENSVDGRILNQFSMDEDANENLRIAVTQEIQNNTNISNLQRTTSNTEQIDNRLYILDKELNQVGSLEGLANGERIYSVRYMKDKAYIVTYKQVDPLFVIDVSDPKNPTKLGELKIPGYSTYLHPYDDTHIIGLGYDTNSDGSRNWNNGLKLSMFDVSDVNNPKEVFTQKIGNRSTYSEATYNHKAILYLKEKNIIAFPIQTYQNRQGFSEVLIYEIDMKNGFVVKGKYSENITNAYGKRVERIVYANGFYYALSEKNVTVLDNENCEIIDKIDIK